MLADDKAVDAALAWIMRGNAERLESYRNRARELRDMASRQPEGSDIREQLLEAASDYEGMALGGDNRGRRDD